MKNSLSKGWKHYVETKFSRFEGRREAEYRHVERTLRSTDIADPRVSLAVTQEYCRQKERVRNSEGKETKARLEAQPRATPQETFPQASSRNFYESRR